MNLCLETKVPTHCTKGKFTRVRLTHANFVPSNSMTGVIGKDMSDKCIQILSLISVRIVTCSLVMSCSKEDASSEVENCFLDILRCAKLIGFLTQMD